MAPVIRHLLGRTMIVKDLATALECSEFFPAGSRFVTQEGELVEAGGLVLGGEAAAHGGIISRKSELLALDQELQQIAASIERIEWDMRSARGECDLLAQRREELTRAIEGGNIEMNEIQQPCVLSVQTGINEPRYVGIRGIRKVASVEIPVKGAGDLGVDGAAVGEAGAKARRLDYFVPEMGDGAEILTGSTDEIVDKLIEMLKAKGGLK